MNESKKRFNEGEPYIFVSYKSEDRDVVKRCIDYLEKNYNMNIWYDRDLNAGTFWNEEACEKIICRKCKAVVFFVSTEALTSEPIAVELSKAKTFDVPIIPINFVNKSFEQTLKDEIRDKYYKDSKKMNVAEKIIKEHLHKDKTYLILNLDNEEFYSHLVQSINSITHEKMGYENPESRKTHSNSHVSKEDVNISNSTGEGKKTVEETKAFSATPEEKADTTEERAEISEKKPKKKSQTEYKTISGKALNDYKHLAEVFVRIYQKCDPKRIENLINSSETLSWELNGDSRKWNLKPHGTGYYDPIPEGELLTAIETLASNFRNEKENLWNIPLNYDSLFDCTGTDYKLHIKIGADTSTKGKEKGNRLVSIIRLKSENGNFEMMQNYLRPSDVGFSDTLGKWSVEIELDKEYQAYLKSCSDKLNSDTGFVRMVKESSIPDYEKNRIPENAIYENNIVLLDGTKFLTFSDWSKDAVEEFYMRFIKILEPEQSKKIKSITWYCGSDENPELKHIYGRKTPDGEYEYLIRARG